MMKAIDALLEAILYHFRLQLLASATILPTLIIRPCYRHTFVHSSFNSLRFHPTPSTPAHMPIHPPSHSTSHSFTHIHSHPLILAHAHTHSLTDALTHTHTQPHPLILAHANTHSHSSCPLQYELPRNWTSRFSPGTTSGSSALCTLAHWTYRASQVRAAPLSVSLAVTSDDAYSPFIPSLSPSTRCAVDSSVMEARSESPDLPLRKAHVLVEVLPLLHSPIVLLFYCSTLCPRSSVSSNNLTGTVILHSYASRFSHLLILISSIAGCVLATVTVSSSTPDTVYPPLSPSPGMATTDFVSWVKRRNSMPTNKVNVMVGHTGDCRAVLSEKGESWASSYLIS